MMTVEARPHTRGLRLLTGMLDMPDVHGEPGKIASNLDFARVRLSDGVIGCAVRDAHAVAGSTGTRIHDRR